MDKINKIILPATIILASLILGGFYYAVEVNKQQSVERQQELKLQEDRRVKDEQIEREEQERLTRRLCDLEAETMAVEQYKKTCVHNCIEGYFYVANRDNYYKSCLQREGLE